MCIRDRCKAGMGNVSQINYGALPYRENEMMDLKCSENKLAYILSLIHIFLPIDDGH